MYTDKYNIFICIFCVFLGFVCYTIYLIIASAVEYASSACALLHCPITVLKYGLKVQYVL